MPQTPPAPRTGKDAGVPPSGRQPQKKRRKRRLTMAWPHTMWRHGDRCRPISPSRPPPAPPRLSLLSSDGTHTVDDVTAASFRAGACVNHSAAAGRAASVMPPSISEVGRLCCVRRRRRTDTAPLPVCPSVCLCLAAGQAVPTPASGTARGHMSPGRRGSVSETARKWCSEQCAPAQPVASDADLIFTHFRPAWFYTLSNCKLISSAYHSWLLQPALL